MFENIAKPEDGGKFADFIPSDSDLGPAMLALNMRQRLFVIAMLDSGSSASQTNSARLAGYADEGVGIRVRGHRLAHSPKVQAAILEEASKRLQAGTLVASGVLLEIASNPKARDADRLKAAAMILDRGGLGAVSEQRISVTHTDNRAEKLLRVVELARLTGQDPRALLGSMADVSDAEVVEAVSPAPLTTLAVAATVEAVVEPVPAAGVRWR